ncbi:MAG: FMN-binding negative transcriptional regulator [Betaproteobacteria bacterium]|nr:FMN-binding negative transcriptional regulator [Betaproteobacteria bacterium]
MIYIPTHFNERDTGEMHGLINSAPFATLVSHADGDIQVTHLPLTLERGTTPYGTLSGHMARANPHWKCLSQGRHLAIFHGPHRYISPAWYGQHPSVPTWNYAVVHASGTCRLIEDEASILRLTANLTERFEKENGTHWQLPADPAYLTTMAAHIVGFELIVTELLGKFKLSQNRAPKDRYNVIAALETAGNAWDLDLARIMKPRAGA